MTLAAGARLGPYEIVGPLGVNSSANRGVPRPTSAVLVGFVAVPGIDRRGSRTYHNSYHDPVSGCAARS